MIVAMSPEEKKRILEEVRAKVDRIIDDAEEVAIEDIAQQYRMDPNTLQDWYDEWDEN